MAGSLPSNVELVTSILTCAMIPVETSHLVVRRRLLPDGGFGKQVNAANRTNDPDYAIFSVHLLTQTMSVKRGS